MRGGYGNAKQKHYMSKVCNIPQQVDDKGAASNIYPMASNSSVEFYPNAFFGSHSDSRN